MAKEMSNNSHVCSETKVNIKSCASSFEKLPYTPEELRVILDFYLFHAPVRKDAKSEGDGFELRYLGDYGWASAAELTKLERELLKTSGITRFLIVKADSITETLADMNLEDDICISHPRAVLNQLHRLSVSEYGELKNDPKEKRLVCLFRHIRNALAHNRVYLFANGVIMLEDYSDDAKTVTARILLKAQTLLDWIYVVDKRHSFYTAPATTETEVSDEQNGN